MSKNQIKDIFTPARKQRSSICQEITHKNLKFPQVGHIIYAPAKIKNRVKNNQSFIVSRRPQQKKNLTLYQDKFFESLSTNKNTKHSSSKFEAQTKHKYRFQKHSSLWLKHYYQSKESQDQFSNTFNLNIGNALQQKKGILNKTLRNNKSKLDTSYINFYNQETKYQEIMGQGRKRKKSKKSDYLTLLNQVSQKKIDIQIEQVNQYRFHTKVMRNQCFDSAFPNIRYGSTLVSSDQNLYLFGGYSQKGIDQPLNFHQYDFLQKQWKKINTCSLKSKRNVMYGIDPPNLSCCYHSAQSYRNHLIFIGGMAMDIDNKKRYFNNDINFFHTQRVQWGRIKWGYSIRSHASTLYGNTLVVYGGINEKEEYTNQIRLVTLNNGNLSHSYHYQLGIKNFTRTADEAVIQKSHHYPIAHHQMINTYDVDPVYLKDMMINAIFVFGGRTSNGAFDNNLRYMDYNKLIQLGQNTTTKVKISQLWEIAQTIGKKPQGRYQHSLTMIKKKGLALLVGGRNAYGDVLLDSWVLDLIRLTWINVSYVQKDNIIDSKQGIYGHSTACINNHFFIFGGFFGNGQFSTTFWDMNYQFKKIDRVQRKSKKLIRKSSKPDIKICSIKTLLGLYKESNDQVKQLSNKQDLFINKMK